MEHSGIELTIRCLINSHSEILDHHVVQADSSTSSFLVLVARSSSSFSWLGSCLRCRRRSIDWVRNVTRFDLNLLYFRLRIIISCLSPLLFCRSMVSLFMSCVLTEIRIGLLLLSCYLRSVLLLLLKCRILNILVQTRSTWSFWLLVLVIQIFLIGSCKEFLQFFWVKRSTKLLLLIWSILVSLVREMELVASVISSWVSLSHIAIDFLCRLGV